MPMPFTAIFFDLDGTLRHNDPPAIPVFHRLAEELGVITSMEQRRDAERWTHAYWASSEEIQADLKEYGEWEDNGAFWNNHTRRHLLKLGAAESSAIDMAPIITKNMLDTYKPDEYVPDDVYPTLRALKREGYKLGVVSNRSKPLDEVVERLKLGELLDFSLAAGEVGLWKPDPRLMYHAASLADVEPGEVTYVGDNYFADVLGARAAGMFPVLIDPQRLFPEADCQVINTIGDLPEVLRAST